MSTTRRRISRSMGIRRTCRWLRGVFLWLWCVEDCSGVWPTCWGLVLYDTLWLYVASLGSLYSSCMCRRVSIGLFQCLVFIPRAPLLSLGLSACRKNDLGFCCVLYICLLPPS